MHEARRPAPTLLFNQGRTPVWAWWGLRRAMAGALALGRGNAGCACPGGVLPAPDSRCQHGVALLHMHAGTRDAPSQKRLRRRCHGAAAARSAPAPVSSSRPVRSAMAPIAKTPRRCPIQRLKESVQSSWPAPRPNRNRAYSSDLIAELSEGAGHRPESHRGARARSRRHQLQSGTQKPACGINIISELI